MSETILDQCETENRCLLGISLLKAVKNERPLKFLFNIFMYQLLIFFPALLQ